MTDKNKHWHKKDNDHAKPIDEDLADFDDLPEGEAHEELAHEESALEHPSYAALEEKLTLAEQQAHENWEKSVRAVAELENVRRRADRDVENAHRYGQEKLIDSLLPVVDSLEQALLSGDKEEHGAMYEGLELTLKLFLDALKKFNIEQLNPAGQPFNPQEHEAISMLDVEGAKPNSVIEVFQKGYKLHDRIIRPARVIVAKAK